MVSTREHWVLEEHFDPSADLDLSTRRAQTSFFEFWPMWLMYAPVALQWIALSLKYRSITLPLAANPKLTLSGMVGMPKSELFGQTSGELAQHIAPWIVYTKTEA
ncbi:MAG: hypothetical protein AAF212_13185, partial [Verrucomicrobiota bacterium]